MAARLSYVKIGVFVIFGLVALVATGVGLGTLHTRKTTVAFYTYFNESVQGLDVDAPVLFRGVRLGKVGDITIAPDRRMVEVRANIEVGALERLGIWPKGAYKAQLKPPRPLPPDLRTQLGSQGLTGTKYVAVDFFDPNTNPPPALSFTPQENYIPAAKSFSKGLEESINKGMESLTRLGDTTLVVMQRIDSIVSDLQRRGVTDQAAQDLTQANSVLRELDRTLKGLNAANVGKTTGATLDALRVVIERFDAVLARLDGENGLVAATQRSINSFGSLGRSFGGATRDLDDTLAEIRDAATSIRLLADELERQPDALVKGRSSGGAH